LNELTNAQTLRQIRHLQHFLCSSPHQRRPYDYSATERTNERTPFAVRRSPFAVPTPTNRPTYRQTNKPTNQQTDGTDGQTNRRTDEPTDVDVAEQPFGWMAE